MNQLVNTILVFLVLTGFLLLASSRLVACIRAVAIQGILLGLLAIGAQDGKLSVCWRAASAYQRRGQGISPAVAARSSDARC